MIWLASLFFVAVPILPITMDPNSVAEFKEIDRGVYQIDAQFTTTAPVDLIFSTLTDYEHHPQFIHTIKKVVEVQSIQISSNVVTKIINEEITAHVLIFSETVHVTLQVNEILDKHRIEFEDLSHKDFVTYKGYWQVTPQADKNIVTHQIVIQPIAKTPRWIVRRLFRKDARKLLDEVQQEIIRRAS